MKLTNHLTVVGFPGKREAAGGWEGDRATILKFPGRREPISRRQLQLIFEDNSGESVRFRDETGKPQEGILINLTEDGVFVIKTKNGREHYVDPEQMGWEDHE